MYRSIVRKFCTALLLLFFLFSFVEIVAEIFNDNFIIWLSKPLIVPLLILYYFFKSKTRNKIFIIALIFTFLASVFFIERTFTALLLGSICMLLFRVLLLYFVVKNLKRPSNHTFMIGALPLLIVYTVGFLLGLESFESSIYFFILNGVILIFIGGFSLGNYLENNSKTNYFLFLSTVFSCAMQFIYVFKLFSEEESIFHAFYMLFFVLSLFLLVLFMLILELKNRKRKIIVA